MDPEDDLTPIHTLATDVTGGSGAATASVEDLASQLDAIVDSLSTGDATADALVQAADCSVDLFLAMRGVDNPDESITVSDSDDSEADVVGACQAALAAAATQVSGNSDLDQALDLANQLVAAVGVDTDTDTNPDTNPEGAAAEPTVVAAVGDEAPPPPEAPPAATDDGAVRFEMPIMVIEGVDTGDGRYIDGDATTWRELPLPVMGITKTTMGHDEAELVARLDSVERIDISGETNPKTGQPYGEGVQALKASGVFATREAAQEFPDLIREGFIRGVSVDLGDVESVLELVDEQGNVVDEDDDPFLDLFLFAEEAEAFADDAPPADEPVDDEDEPKYRLRERMTAARVMGVTICPFPAFEGAYIRLDDGTETPRVAGEGVVASQAIYVTDEPFERECNVCEGGTVVASHQSAPMYPPKAWFEMAEPNELTPMTITDDGRIFGHLAGWQTCHGASRAYGTSCLLAAKSRTNYANFHVGGLKTAEGEVIPVGHVTMNTGHADMELDARGALAHYDHTGTVSATIVASDGRHGIWVCGALEPDLSEAQVRRLRGAALSGDWRPHGRGSELIAALAVNSPGFLVPRVSMSHGRVKALVAAGVVQGIEHKPEGDERLSEFMDYVLSRDAQPLRDKIKANHEAAQATVLAQGEKVAATLRERVHKS